MDSRSIRINSELVGRCLLIVLMLLPLGDCQQMRRFSFLNYPDPRLDPKACGNTAPSRLCDPGNIMTDKQVAALNSSLTADTYSLSMMIAVVPVLLDIRGDEVRTGGDDFRGFAVSTYNKWMLSSSTPNSRSLIVVYVASVNAVWVYSNNTADITEECICQVTYESELFLNSKGISTLFDIYIRQFRQISLGTVSCSKPNDTTVPWKINNGICTWPRTKTARVTKISPLVGAVRGGTELTITGRYLDGFPDIILIGTVPCNPSKRRTSSVIYCTTSPLNNPKAINKRLPVYFLIGNNNTIDTGIQFMYVKPKLNGIHPTTTTISGGLRVTVDGENLRTAKRAVMLVNMRSTLSGRLREKEYRVKCQIASTTTIYCYTPTLEPELVKRTARAYRRRKRQAGDGGLPISDLDLEVKIILDEDIIPFNDVPDGVQDFKAYKNPALERFEGAGQIVTFISVWPILNRQIEIKGSGLTPVLEGHQITVNVGDGFCHMDFLFENKMLCQPPVYEPNAEEEHPSVNVSIGYSHYFIGHLEYQDTLWKYPPTRYGLIGAAALVFVIFLIIRGLLLSQTKETT